MFGRLATRGCKTNLFHNVGLFLPGADPLVIAKATPVVLSHDEFFKLLAALSSMQIGDAQVIPGITRLKERAVFFYKLTGAVPIGVIDVTFDALAELPLDKLLVDAEGRFDAESELPIAQHRLLATAPLVKGVFANRFKVQLVDELVITNGKRTRKYGVRYANSQSMYEFRHGLQHEAATSESFFSFSISSDDGRTAVSWVNVYPTPTQLPHRRLAVLRRQRPETEK